jgi:hypothetical protein
MKMTLCAGAFALAMTGVLSNNSVTYADEFATASASSQLSTSINIVRIRSVLKLTSAQEPFWPAVEAALYDLARQQAQVDQQAGFVHRISRRVVSIVLNGAAIERLAHAARPLMASLSDDQKHAASGLAQEMGLGPVVAALN